MGSVANPRDFPRVGLLSAWCHADLSPSAATYLAGRIVGTAAGHHPVGATFVSDCATVLRGLESGPKWCTAARRPHADVWRRIWDCFRDIGDEVHIDSVATCKAHLSKAERAKLDETGRFTVLGYERTNWPKKERMMIPSNPSCAIRTRELSKRVRQSSAMLAVSSSRVVTPPQGWDEEDERWKRAKLIPVRPHVLRCNKRQWHCEVCDKRASVGAAKAKLVRTECVGHPATALGEHARPQCHLLAQTGSFVWCCRCGARAAKFARKEAWRTVCPASEVSRVCTKHSLAVEWLAPQGESLSWITETVHDTSVGQVAAKPPRGQL